MEDTKKKLPQNALNLISAVVKYIETADEKQANKSHIIRGLQNADQKRGI